MIVSWTTSSMELKQKEDKIYNKVGSNQFSKEIFAFQSVIKSSTRNLFFKKFTKPTPSYVLRYSLWSADSKLRMADRSPCFDFQTFHKMWFSLRRYRSKKVLPHRQRYSLNFSTQYEEAKLYWPATRFNVSKMFLGCQIGQAFVTFIFSWIKLFLFLFFSSRTCIFWKFPSFSVKFTSIQSWNHFIHTVLACATNFNLTLIFITWIFTGLCVVRCAIWLASRKYHRPKHV